MELSPIKITKENRLFESSIREVEAADNFENELKAEISVSLEAEIPEELYMGMKEFICLNPQWDQYTLMSSALANFLFQNGSEDRAVTEKYLNDLFTLTDA